jgi:transcriptional regulator with XRE-family HTH domain
MSISYDSKEAFGKLLTALVKRDGRRIPEIAEDSGVSRQYIYAAMKGKFAMSEEAIIGLAGALGEEPEWMIVLSGKFPTVFQKKIMRSPVEACKKIKNMKLKPCRKVRLS